jgi:hypothetical protein
MYIDWVCTQVCQQYEWLGYGAVRLPWSIVYGLPDALQVRFLWTFLKRAASFLCPCDLVPVRAVLIEELFNPSQSGPWYEQKLCICRNSRWLEVRLKL